MKKGLFLVYEHLWNVFLQTGNVEAYLLLKHLEKKASNHEEETSMKMEKNEMKIDSF
ncbi:MAG: YqzL family protein [Bacillales bacterium]